MTRTRQAGRCTLSAAAILAALTAGFAPPLAAQTIDDVVITKVNVGGDQWRLSVTNNTSTLQIVGFAVAENAATAVDGRTPDFGWWDAGIIRESEWNFGVDVLDQLAGPFITLTDFDATFGTDPGTADRAVVYWLSDAELPQAQALFPIAELMVPFLLESEEPEDADRIFPGETASGFAFTAVTAGSPFAALLSTGLPGAEFALTAVTGEVTVIPLPAAGPLLLAACVLLGWKQRKR
ncbi:MAG: hypothetical protein KJO38_02595 [Gammaproteobacteria bacterium]|nr:hypothetical protein [Gammaproteobacteria bacterium]